MSSDEAIKEANDLSDEAFEIIVKSVTKRMEMRQWALQQALHAHSVDAHKSVDKVTDFAESLYQFLLQDS